MTSREEAEFAARLITMQLDHYRLRGMVNKDLFSSPPQSLRFYSTARAVI